MKTNNWLILGVVAAALVACDPYDDPQTASEVRSVFASDGGGSIDASGTTGTVTIADVACDAPGWIQIVTNGRLNGAAIQQTPGDCRPAGGWLTVTPAAPAGLAWYACYMPSSPASYEGGSIIIYRAPFSEDDPGTAAVEPTFYSDGWHDAVGFAQPFFSITGTTVSGVTIPTIDVTCAAPAP